MPLTRLRPRSSAPSPRFAGRGKNSALQHHARPAGLAQPVAHRARRFARRRRYAHPIERARAAAAQARADHHGRALTENSRVVLTLARVGCERTLLGEIAGELHAPWRKRGFADRPRIGLHHAAIRAAPEAALLPDQPREEIDREAMRRRRALDYAAKRLIDRLALGGKYRARRTNRPHQR